jgi:GNAT superfamily N-acetyltransferase
MSEIRSATTADAAGLAELRAGAEGLLMAHRGGAALLADLPRLLKGTDGPGAASWVADGPESLQGGATAVLDGSEGCFAIWVDPRCRRQGLGRSLATVAIGWLRARGAEHVDSLSLPGDRATKQLLEQLGFKARLLVMREGG